MMSPQLWHRQSKAPQVGNGRTCPEHTGHVPLMVSCCCIFVLLLIERALHELPLDLL